MEANCPRCGLDLPKGTIRFCPECGFEVSCGYKSEEEPVSTPVSVIPQPPPIPPQLPPIELAKSPKSRSRKAKRQPEPPPIPQTSEPLCTIAFADDEWIKDEDGAEELAKIKDEERDIEEDSGNEELKRWLRAKIRMVADSDDPKIQYLLRNKNKRVNLLCSDREVGAILRYVFVKKGYEKIYVRLIDEDERCFGLDKIEIVNITKDGVATGLKPSCLLVGCITPTIIVVLIWLMS